MRYLWVTRRYADWVGVPHDQVAGRSLLEVLGDEGLQSMRPHIAAALAGRPMRRQTQVRHAEELRWIEVDCVPTFDERGAVDGWMETINDITERKRIEDELADGRRVLETFFDGSPFFMGVAGLDGERLVLLRVNGALARQLGKRPDEIAGRPALELASNEVVRRWIDHYRACQSTGAPVQFEYEQEFLGSSRWLRASVAFVAEVEGHARFCFVAEDVTEYRYAIDALREANRAKDEFLAMLGHELRNPLAPIVTALRILQRDDRPDPKTLAIIDRQVQYVIRLVDDLLDVSRITRGKIQMKRQRVSIGPVVNEAVEMVMPLIEERRQHLEVQLPPSELSVDGDESRLAQVIANLLSNASKYTEPGGRITVRTYPQGDEIVVEVVDNGIGITPELLPHVFDLFTQERQSADRARGGLGIGLTIVRKLVELHGGHVTAESAGPGRGSCFTVRLPAAAREPAAVELSHAQAPAIALSRKRVLAVDDNQDALEMLAEVLREAGHEVATAADGPQALEVVGRFHPDVAILDIGLPVMDGYELARRIREQLGEAAPRLIALTGYGQASDRERAYAAGFANHLTKPVDVGCLLGALDVKEPGHGGEAP